MYQGYILKEIRRKTMNMLGVGIIFLILPIFMFMVAIGPRASNIKKELLLVCIFSVFFLVGIIILVLSINKLQNLDNHPALLSLKPFGDPLQIVKQIEQELTSQEVQKFGRELQTFQLGKTGEPGVGPSYITKNWLVFCDLVKPFQFLRLDELIWAFIKEVTVTTSIMSITHYQFNARDLRGREVIWSADRESIYALFQELQTISPGSKFGYDEALDKVWKRSPLECAQTITGCRPKNDDPGDILFSS